VDVVDAQHERPLLGEVRAQPVEAVQRRRQAHRDRGALEHERGREPGRAREVALPLGVVEAADRLLEELQGHPEGKVALQIPAAGAEHARPPARRERGRLSEQARLAEPAGGLHEDNAALARLGIAQRDVKSTELRFPLQQRARELGRR
jgi:hypothetical protein